MSVSEDRVREIIEESLSNPVYWPQGLKDHWRNYTETVAPNIPISSVVGTYVVADTVDGLGTPVHGRVGMVRAGTTPYDYITLTYDEEYGKWISAPQIAALQIDPTVGETMDNDDVEPATTASYALLPFAPYDAAGLTFEFRLTAAMMVTSGDTGYLVIAFTTWPADGGAPSSGVDSAAHQISTTSTTISLEDSGWAGLPEAVTVDDFLLAVVRKDTSPSPATLTFGAATIFYRFVSA